MCRKRKWSKNQIKIKISIYRLSTINLLACSGPENYLNWKGTTLFPLHFSVSEPESNETGKGELSFLTLNRSVKEILEPLKTV